MLKKMSILSSRFPEALELPASISERGGHRLGGASLWRGSSVISMIRPSDPNDRRISGTLYRLHPSFAPVPTRSRSWRTDRDPPAKRDGLRDPDAAQDCSQINPRRPQTGGPEGRVFHKRPMKTILAGSLIVLSTAMPLTALAAPPKAQHDAASR